MSRGALLLVLLAASSTAAADLPPGALARLGDDRFRAGGPVTHLALAPDGKRFATVRAIDYRFLVLTVWEVPSAKPEGFATTGRPLHEQRVNAELFRGLVWGEGGAFAVALRTEPAPKGRRGTVISDDFCVWDFTDPKAAPPLLPEPELLKRVSGSITDAPPKRGEYTHFHFSADGRRVVAEFESATGTFAVRVFELKPTASAARLTRSSTLDLGAERANAVRVSANGDTVITFRELADPDRRPVTEFVATVWDVARGTPSKPFLVRTDNVFVPRTVLPSLTTTNQLLLTPTGREVIVVATEQKTWGFDEVPLALPLKNIQPKRRSVARWPSELDAEKRPFFDPGGSAFNASGTVLVIAANRKTFVIDLTEGKELGRLEGHANTPDAVAVSADGATIATADVYGLVRLWNAKTFRPLHPAAGHRAPVEHAELSPDGKRLLTWAADETARLWDVATGAELRAFTGVVGPREGADDRPTFTPDGTAIVFRTKDKLVARDLLTGLEVPLPDPKASRVESLSARSPDGRTSARVAQSNRGAVQLLEAASGSVRRELSGHRGEVRVLGFTPDGSRLLTAGSDHTILVWDMRLQNVPLPDAIKKETDAAKLWESLATGKADVAYLAMARLAREPNAAIKLVKMKLKPVAKAGNETEQTNLADARAIELLEALDRDDARALLKELASGHADAFRTQEAKRALERNRAVTR